MKKFLTGALSFALVIMMAVVNVSAAEIVIDGQYSDWENSDSAQSPNGPFYSKIDMRTDGDYLYIYAKETSVNPWENYFSYASPTVTDKNGKTKNYVFTPGDNNEIIIRDHSYNIVKKSKGIRTKSDTYEYELAIFIEGIGEIDYVTMNTDYGYSERFYPDSEVKQPESGETEDETVDEIESVEPPKEGIVIDGKFDDWESYPHTLVTNWNMPQDQRTEQNCRKLGLTYDEENIYFHVKMISGWEDRFNGNQYTLTVESDSIELFIFHKDGTPIPHFSLGEGVYDLDVYYKNGTSGVTDFTYIPGAQAIVTVEKGKPDEAEVRVSFRAFEEIFGKKYEDVKEVKIENPNIFDHGISSAGSSTGAILGVVVCVASVGAGSYIYGRKKLKVKKQ